MPSEPRQTHAERSRGGGTAAAPPKLDDSRPPAGWSGVTVHELTKEFPRGRERIVALQEVSLRLEQGEFLAIVGPSGCGKTTLLRILAGLELPTGGDVEFSIAHEGRALRAMVFQEHGVFPWMTVLDNVAYGLTVRGIGRQQREPVARHYIEMLGLTGFERSYPNQLSGGMRQRVSVARAFAIDPALLLMDEPFASLDELTRMTAHEDLLRIWEETKKTVVFITHSLDEALLLADRVIVMSRRPGRIKDVVAVDLSRPRDVRELPGTAEFVSMRQRVWASLRDEIAQPARAASPVHDPSGDTL